MSTRSRIAIENQDGTVTSIYCHFDGYLSHNGEILQNHFQDREKVEQLIALGDLSCLGEDISEGAIDTIAYHRDRGEDFNQKQHTDVEDFYNEAFEMGEEYGYLFTKDNKWLVSTGGPVAELQLALAGEDVL
jgi:hypothetical protein